MDISESKEYDTFSGYILEKIGRIPKEKEKITIGEFVITVKEMKGNRIRSFIVRRNVNSSTQA
jgi:putative hemolysin